MLRSLSALLASAVILIGAAPQGKAQQRHRNVVLIIADDHGKDMGCYGNRRIKTPHLDALAAEGTRYENAFCTTASCSPSRSVLLTGLHTHTNGMYGLQHAAHKQSSLDSVRSLPVLLKDSGYRTCSIGKLHVGPEKVYAFDAFANQGAPPRSTVRMAENAEKWIQQDRTKPFFLSFAFVDPHRAEKGFGNDRPYPGVTEITYDPNTLTVPDFLPDRPEVRKELAEYYQAVSRLDQGVGRLMQALKNTGTLDDTLIFYLSDNGIPFPGAKTTLYEPGIRLPLIVRSPAQTRRGGVSNAMVSWTDITPTILEWTGAKAPAYPLAGRSFLPTLDQTDPPGWDEVYGSHQFHEITMYYPMRLIRTRKYKLIMNLAHPLPFPIAQDLFASPTWQGVLQRGDKQYGQRPLQAYLQRPRLELYDLEQDPKERVNQAGNPKYAAVLTELQGKLRAFQERTKDPWLIKYEHE